MTETKVTVNTLTHLYGKETNKTNSNKNDVSRVVQKPRFWFRTWSDKNRAVQSQKMARGLKFRI